MGLDESNHSSKNKQKPAEIVVATFSTHPEDFVIKNFFNNQNVSLIEGWLRNKR